MTFKRSWKFLILAAVSIGVGYAFLAGPLFAWSPIKPGYDVIRLERADVYFGEGVTPDPVLRNVDQFIRDTEQFHQMQLPRRMTIIVCRSWSDFHRFLPTVPGESVGAATPEFGTVTYLTPKIQEMKFDPAEFIRHEMSHAVLEQNSTLWNSIRFKQSPWFLEGLAVLAGNQRAYGSWDDFERRIAQQDIEPLFSRQPYRTPGFDMRFAYLTWRYFLEWTTEKRGRAAIQQYMQGFMKRPQEAEQLFSEVYGEDLQTAVRSFEAAVRSKQWRG